MNGLKFKQILDNSKPGTAIVYFTGSLMFARKFNLELERLADTVWRLAGMRWNPNAKPTAAEGHQGQWQAIGERRVTLTQRRLSEPMGWEYVATKI